MKTIIIKNLLDKASTIKTGATFLKAGKVVVLPTDTIYGFSCLTTNAKAINKIYKLKQRPAGRPFIILISSLSQLNKYCYLSAKNRAYLKKLWQGNGRPTTVVLPSRGLLAKNLEASDKTLAVRLPKSKFLLKMIRATQTPIVSTSLNISGRDFLLSPENAEKIFNKNKIDLIIDQGVLKNKSSKIIDLTETKIKIIRK